MTFADIDFSSARSRRMMEEMDVLVDEARAFQETIHGPKYWNRPLETTGPKDPFPGHHRGCDKRLGRPRCSVGCPEAQS